MTLPRQEWSSWIRVRRHALVDLGSRCSPGFLSPRVASSRSRESALGPAPSSSSMRLAVRRARGVVGTAAAPRPRPEVRGWVRPVAGAVVRPFDRRRSRFGAGHLGVDFAAPPGTAVSAAGPGRRVVRRHGRRLAARRRRARRGSAHVVLVPRLDDGAPRPTTCAGRRASARRAARAEPRAAVLHFGLRSGDDLPRPDAAVRRGRSHAVVHLAPTTEPFRTRSREERRGLLDGLLDGVGASVAAVGRGRRRRGSTAAARPVRRRSGAPRSLAEELGATSGVAIGRGRARLLDERRRCDAPARAPTARRFRPPPSWSSPGSTARRSRTAAPSASRSTPSATAPTRSRTSRTRPDGGDYAADATYDGRSSTPPGGSPSNCAARSAASREARSTCSRTRRAGSWSRVFLRAVRPAGDPSYPPLGTVVTLSSPLDGRAAARPLVGRLRGRRAGRALLDEVRASAPASRTSNADAAVRDLAADSHFMRAARGRTCRTAVDLTTIGAALRRRSCRATRVSGDAARAHDRRSGYA